MLPGGCGVYWLVNDVIILAMYGRFIWPYMEDLFGHIWTISLTIYGGFTWPYMEDVFDHVLGIYLAIYGGFILI